MTTGGTAAVKVIYMSKVIDIISRELRDIDLCRTTECGSFADKWYYDKACFYYRKGILSEQELFEFLKLHDRAGALIHVIACKCYNAAKDRKVSVKQLLKEFQHKEEHQAITKLKKAYDTLDLKETIDNWSLILGFDEYFKKLSATPLYERQVVTINSDTAIHNFIKGRKIMKCM